MGVISYQMAFLLIMSLIIKMKVIMWLKSIRTATIDIEGNSYHIYRYVNLASIAVLDLDC